MKRKFDDAREQFVHVDVVTSGASQYSLGSLGAGLSFLQVKQLLAIASGVRVGQQRLYPKTPCRGSFLVDDDDGLCNASTMWASSMRGARACLDELSRLRTYRSYILKCNLLRCT